MRASGMVPRTFGRGQSPARGRYDGFVKQLFLCATMIVAAAVAGSAQTSASANLSEVKTVYILPMGSGMDQYLASRLTRGGVLQVVTDPAKADALLTDHLGAAFEASIKELYPELKPVAETSGGKGEAASQKAEEKSEAKAAEKAATKEPDNAATDNRGARGSFDLKPVGPEVVRPPGRARGTLFLVRRGSWEVLWSAYREPRGRQSKDLDRRAGELVKELKASLQPASGTKPESK